jgi:hypothetical protein
MAGEERSVRKALLFLVSPTFTMWWNLIAAAATAVMIYPAIKFGWVYMIAFVSAISIWNLAVTHLGTAVSAYVARLQDQDS